MKGTADFRHLVESVAKLPKIQKMPKNTEATSQILNLFYENLHGPYRQERELAKKDQNCPLKPPLIVSFHPKLSLLNNNIHETVLACLLAEKLGHTPVWIPYVYDTATHSAAEGGKIRAPTYAFIEGSFIQLRAAAQIHGNIIKTEKPINKKEINDFFQALEFHLTHKLGTLQGQINQYNFGHFLFDIKQKIMKVNRKGIKAMLDELKHDFLADIQGTTSMAESLGKISLRLLHRLGIPMNLCPIEPSMPQIVEAMLTEITKRESIKADPSLLEGLFVHYNVKDKSRTPVQFTGDAFLSIDDNANRLFDGTIQDLCDGIRHGSILPTGPSLILMFAALGCQITLGGLHTQEYYPDYLTNARRLLTETGFNSSMKVIGYGDLRSLDTRNMTDVMATIRILEKVGSRTIVQKQSVHIPNDVVDHLEFIAGREFIPSEYLSLLPEVDANAKKPAAITKEADRYRQIMGWNKLSGDELKKRAAEIKPYFRQLDLETIHPERLKMAIETLASDTEMRMNLLKDNIAFEQHLLGGKIPLAKQDEAEFFNEGNDNDEEDQPFREIYDGMILRSKRVPTLLEMAIYQTPLDLPFQIPVSIAESESQDYYCLLLPTPPENKEQAGKSRPIFTEFSDAFRYFIPERLLPGLFR